jgi:hypothetical protein
MTMADFTISEFLPFAQACNSLALGDFDTVIHAPGFEDRTMAIVDTVTCQGTVRGILLDYRPVNSNNRLADVRTGLTSIGCEIDDQDVLTYHRFEPDDFESRLERRLVGHLARRAVIDISSMSKLAIMLVLNVCRRLNLQVEVFYAEAESYAPSRDAFEHARRNDEIHQPTLQVFTGVHGVVRVDSLSSVAMQGQPTAALVFMSFNDALTQVLLNSVYPGRLLLINGRPPLQLWREAATAWIHEQVRREWEDDNPLAEGIGHSPGLPMRVASTLDYRQTVLLLLSLYWALSAHYRVLLAPSGSKMQTLGCYVIKALHPDIHIEYPSPDGFSREYSAGVGPRWTVDFGDLSQWLTQLGAAERREYLEIPTRGGPDGFDQRLARTDQL